jgi:hypothetical protein
MPEDVPSVLVPIWGFFAARFGILPSTLGDFYNEWPEPFKQHLRSGLENEKGQYHPNGSHVREHMRLKGLQLCEGDHPNIRQSTSFLR